VLRNWPANEATHLPTTGMRSDQAICSPKQVREVLICFLRSFGRQPLRAQQLRRARQGRDSGFGDSMMHYIGARTRVAYEQLYRTRPPSAGGGTAHREHKQPEC